jgi:branched-chain amino acid transport system substrate-binding protein
VGRKRRVTAATISALCIAGALIAISASSANAGRAQTATSAAAAPYVIGFTSDFTSNFGYLGLGLKSGLNAYWGYVNKHGGINHHPVKMIALDDDSQVNRGVANVTQLITQDHAIMIAGVMYSVICTANVPVLTQHKVPEICGLAESSTVRPANPWVFATLVDQAAYAVPMMNMARILMQKAHPGDKNIRIAVLFSTGSAAINQWNDEVHSIAQQWGWNNVTTQIVPISAIDMSSEISNVIASKPDVMLLGAGNDAWVTAGMNQLKAAGNPFPVVSYDVPAWTTVQAINDKQFYYLSALGYGAPNAKKPAGISQFVRLANAEGVNPNAAYVLRGYLQGLIIGNALQRCGWPCTGAKLQAQLNKTNFNTNGIISGNVSLSPTNHQPVTSLGAYQWLQPFAAPSLVLGRLKVGNQ